MRGKDEVRGSLFSYVDLEQRIRPDHPLRTIRAIVNAAPADMSAEFDALYPPMAALHLIAPHADRPNPVTLGADKGFDARDFAAELREVNVTPHVAQNTSGRR